MPITKTPKTKQPLWKEWDQKAQKQGQRNTIYLVNGDHFTGEWENNKKNGKGTQYWKRSGAYYDGDWKDNLRHGFGTYSLPSGLDSSSYQKVYAGGWKNDKKHGHGTNFYSSTEYFEGEWYENKRSGWGRMYYADGSVYEGEWFNDKRNGSGMLRLVNENRYEGQWKEDVKHGDGKYYYLDKGQLYIGTWVNDVAKCGVMKDFNRVTACDPTTYPIPQLKLKDLDNVLADAKNDLIYPF